MADKIDLCALGAVEAIEAMRDGELRAEDYARALLDRGGQLPDLNAFLALDRDSVLEAARSADKARGWTSNNLEFGPVKNPRDRTRIPGGSSGGSAAAVGAGIAPLAVAEDTWGLDEVSLRGVRLGVPIQWLEGMDREVERAVEEAFRRLEAAGAVLVRARLPDEAIDGRA